MTLRLVVRRIENEKDYSIIINNKSDNLDDDILLEELVQAIKKQSSIEYTILFWIVWGIISNVLNRVYSIDRNKLFMEKLHNAGILISECAGTGVDGLPSILKDANVLYDKKPVFEQSDLDRLYRDIKRISNSIENDMEKSIEYRQIFHNIEGKNDVYTIDMKKIKNSDELEETWFSFLKLSLDHVLENLTNGRVFFDLRFPSSGESNKTGLYGSISQCNDLHKNMKKNTILSFLDEPDNSYHMEWKQELVNDIINKYHVFQEINMQIFVSSHSPILLSDFPEKAQITLRREYDSNKACIIKTQKRGISSSFNQQAYTMCHDSFEMNSIVGRFAEQTIQSVDKEMADIANNLMTENVYIGKERIEDLQRDLDTCKTIVDMIKEPLIGSALLQRYYWCKKELDERVKIIDSNKH